MDARLVHQVRPRLDMPRGARLLGGPGWLGGSLRREIRAAGGVPARACRRRARTAACGGRPRPCPFISARRSRRGAALVRSGWLWRALPAASRPRARPSSAITCVLPPSGQRFGASPAELRATISGLRRLGLRIGAVSVNHLLIKVSATAAIAERAFHTKLVRYRLASGRQCLRQYLATPPWVWNCRRRAGDRRAERHGAVASGRP